MSDRLTDRRAIWRALYAAYQWEESLLDAYENVPADDPDAIEVRTNCKRHMAAFDRVARRYYGRSLTHASDEKLSKAQLVPLRELMKTVVDQS